MDMRRYRGFLVPGLYEGIAANRDEAVERFYQGLVGAARRVMRTAKIDVTVIGAENIPSDGSALIVSNHSGTIALDSVITQLAIHDAHPQGRFLRMLGADLVFQLPVVGDVARKTGATLATNADKLDFGIVGCRRSVPHLQRLLTHLDTALEELEKVARVTPIGT